MSSGGINVQPILYPAGPELCAARTENQIREAAAMLIEEARVVASEPPRGAHPRSGAILVASEASAQWHSFASRSTLRLGCKPCDKLSAPTRRWHGAPGLSPQPYLHRQADGDRFRNNTN